MNLGPLAGLRLHPSRVVRQGAPPLLREMPGVAVIIVDIQAKTTRPGD